MSTDANKDAASPLTSAVQSVKPSNLTDRTGPKAPKPPRKVFFSPDDQLVTQYFEPANPWQNVPVTSKAELANEYRASCVRHRTLILETILEQIEALPDNVIGGLVRAPKLVLSECNLLGTKPIDALEALFRKVQFVKISVENCLIDDEAAEALFDMIEFYESANCLALHGHRDFGVHGWQAATRMIKNSVHLSELEASDCQLDSSHSAVLSRAFRPALCCISVLHVQRANISGEPLLCLLMALKSNQSVRELRLSDNNLIATDAIQISTLLRINTCLRVLDLSNNEIRDQGLCHITDAICAQAKSSPGSHTNSPEPTPRNTPLYEPRGLSFLILWNNQLTRNCANNLADLLRASQTLSVLNVGRNALGSESIRLLKWLGPLACLGLQATKMGVDAAQPLADIIRNTRLQRLDLRDNKLGSVGLKYIYEAMKENNTLTQIDLDDPVESSTLTFDSAEVSACAYITNEIRILCKRNEPVTSTIEQKAHRKISLTCHTMAKWSSGGRLRSPLPSPAPSPNTSPTPLNRFEVTRVTPERECSSSNSSNASSPSTPTRPHASRFKVMQVTEPPKIQIQPATDSRKMSSRFCVTRNYDATYNPSKAKNDIAKSDEANSDKVKRDENKPSDCVISDIKKCDQVTSATVETCDVKLGTDDDEQFKNIDDIALINDCDTSKSKTINKIAAITQDLGKLIHEMKVLTKSKIDDLESIDVPVMRDIVLKKNKSDSNLGAVVEGMSKTAFYDSSSSLEVSGSSVESLDNKTELDRRKYDDKLLNISLSSCESTSPMKDFAVYESSDKDRNMVASIDSGIEYSLKNTYRDPNVTLTNIYTETEDTLTSPKIIDMPQSNKNERSRKISLVGPSPSFQLPRDDAKENKLPSHLEKLLSLFQHPTSLFRNQEDEKKSIPQRKESITSSFWNWGSVEKSDERDRDSNSSETTDSTLSERVQISFIDESFSKKLDSKTPSTDTDNTLSEFQSIATIEETSDHSQKDAQVEVTTTDLVQNLVLSDDLELCDNKDLSNPNDMTRLDEANICIADIKCSDTETQVMNDSIPSKVQTVDNNETITADNAKSLALEFAELNINQDTQWDLSLIPPQYETSRSFDLNLLDDDKMKVDKVNLESIDLGKEALYLDKDEKIKLIIQKDKEIDLSPELVLDTQAEKLKLSPVIPEKAKLIKSNSLEELSQISDVSPRKSKIAFKLPETSSTPRDIPRSKLRTRSGSSPNSLPENLKHGSLPRLDHFCKKKKKVSSLGKIAKDSLLALNLSEDEIAEFKKSYKVSVESLRSLESVSEDANSQSGYSGCRCLRMSQESLISLDSIPEDCRCNDKGASSR